MLYLFDLDGVIIDSNDLIRQCYVAAGADPTCVPDDILGSEGRGWLTDAHDEHDAKTIHEGKNGFYVDALGDGDNIRILSGYNVAVALATTGRSVGIVTGAPFGSCHALASWLPVWPFKFHIEAMRTPDKMDWIARCATDRGVYIDDQIRFIDLPHGWRHVHYTGQDATTLWKEVIA